MVSHLEAYPDTLPAEARGFNDAAYYAAYHYAALAQEEALYRFPDTPAAPQWRWELAFDYVRSGDARAGATYADLIETALNAGATTPEALPGWFSSHETRLTLSTQALRQEGNRLLELSAEDSGTYLWLVQGPEGFQVYPLNGEDDFDLAGGAGLFFGLADINGDGTDDLVSVHAHQPGDGPAFYYTDLELYRLAQPPPQRFAFQPPPNTHLGWGENDGWSVVYVAAPDRPGTIPLFRIRGLPSDRCTAVEVVHDYVWNGRFLRLLGNRYEINPAGASSTRFCLPFIFAAAEQGNAGAREYLQATLPIVPAETAEEWRFRLGVYQALAGNFEEATATFTEIISQPLTTPSDWVEPAQRFLQTYNSPDDLYLACAQLELCDETVALSYLTATIPPSAYGVVTSYWRNWGVPVNNFGFFDIDGDGAAEQWVLVNNDDLRSVNVWLLLRWRGSVDAAFVDTVTRDDLSLDLERLAAVENEPVIRLRTSREELLFVLEEDPTGERPPRVVQLRPQSQSETANFTAQLLAENQAALFGGVNATTVRDVLLAFRDSQGFACALSEFESICPDYLYTLGLAAELAGDEATAVAAYVQLWDRYPAHPYATLARAKLALAPTPTPTATPTETPAP